jgi:hypothetical protein
MQPGINGDLMDKEKARGHTIHADKASFQRHGFDSLNKLKMNIYCAMIASSCAQSLFGVIQRTDRELQCRSRMRHKGF